MTMQDKIKLNIRLADEATKMNHCLDQIVAIRNSSKNFQSARFVVTINPPKKGAIKKK